MSKKFLVGTSKDTACTEVAIPMGDVDGIEAVNSEEGIAIKVLVVRGFSLRDEGKVIELRGPDHGSWHRMGGLAGWLGRSVVGKDE